VAAERAPVAVLDNDRFLATAERRLQTYRDQARLAVAAVLESLAERLSRGEARDLVEQLPIELSVWLLTDRREAFARLPIRLHDAAARGSGGRRALTSDAGRGVRPSCGGPGGSIIA
jgi:uncharacterized protein (DUF2267 family)